MRISSRALQSNENSLNKIQAAGYKFTSSNGMIYNSLSIKFKDIAREESTTEWETLLDTIAGIKAFLFYKSYYRRKRNFHSGHEE